MDLNFGHASTGTRCIILSTVEVHTLAINQRLRFRSGRKLAMLQLGHRENTIMLTFS